jgi:hypothetical protein
VADEELRESWRRTTEHLRRARSSLTDQRPAALGLFDEFLDHNELGVAFDVLVDVAAEQRAPSATWNALRDAAEELGVAEGDGLHGASLTKVITYLEAGREWFELQALLNEWDPIGVYDAETNFPADEYDCLYEPLMSRLRIGQDAKELGDFLERELKSHFGLDPRSSRPQDFAQRVVDWYSRRPE